MKLLSKDLEPPDICSDIGACNQTKSARIVSPLSCDDCDLYLVYVRAHLLRDVSGYMKRLEGRLFCNNPGKVTNKEGGGIARSVHFLFQSLQVHVHYLAL